MRVRAVLLRRSRLPWVITAALAVVAGTAVLLVAVLDEPAHPHYCSCKPPPDTSAVKEVPRDWQHAAAHRDAQAAWRLLTPEARRSYGSPGRLAAALARITPDPRGPAEWRLVGTVTQGRGTPSAFLYLLVEKRTLRPAGAVVVHSMAAGGPDGRVDPAPAATVRILEPAAHAKLGDRPPMRAATAYPPAYVAVQAGRLTPGATGAIRGPDGRDEPFGEPLGPGPTLIVAVQSDGNGRFAYGTVKVTIG